MRLTAIGIQKIKTPATRREIPDTGSGGLYLVVQPKSGAKSWAMRFRRPRGERCKITLGKYPEMSLHEARTRTAEINEQRAGGRDVFREMRLGQVKHEENTFGAVVREFMADHKVRTHREIGTVLGLRYPKEGGEPEEIKGGLAARWADRQIGEITGLDVHEVIMEAMNRATPGTKPKRKGKSESRGRKMRNALSSLFGWAWDHRRRVMTVNPALGNKYHFTQSGDDDDATRALSAPEIKLVWKAAGEASYPFGDVVKLLLGTGSRLSEISRLEWRELSADLSQITLPKARTKNAREHIIYLAPATQAILKKVKRIEGCAYVFTTNGKTPISGWSKFKRRLDDAIAERNDGKALTPWRLHDLRHTVVTHMDEALKVREQVIEAVVNHVSGTKAGIKGRYNHATYDEERLEAVERWAAWIEGVVTDRPANVVDMVSRSLRGER
jgi:integrase